MNASKSPHNSYFRRFSAACAAQGWRMERGRFVAPPLPSGGEEAALVLQWADQLATDQHRGITLDDLRYAIHYGGQPAPTP